MRLGDYAPPQGSERDRQRWLARREADTASLTRSSLRRIVGGAYEAFTDTLTASADITALDSIPSAWAVFVDETLGPRILALYLSGAQVGWAGMPWDPPAAFADRWAAVVNEYAVAYQAAATNRLVGVGENVWQHVRAATVRSLQDGTTNEALKSEIEGITRFSEYRADTIARTETISAYVNGDRQGVEALGDYGPVEKAWLAALDNRTRESHAEADGQTVPMGEPFIVGGVAMNAPHDASAPPEEVVNCRCVVEYLYPGDLRPDGSNVPGDDVQIDRGALVEDE